MQVKKTPPPATKALCQTLNGRFFIKGHEFPWQQMQPDQCIELEVNDREASIIQKGLREFATDNFFKVTFLHELDKGILNIWVTDVLKPIDTPFKVTSKEKATVFTLEFQRSFLPKGFEPEGNQDQDDDIIEVLPSGKNQKYPIKELSPGWFMEMKGSRKDFLNCMNHASNMTKRAETTLAVTLMAVDMATETYTFRLMKITG